MSYEVWDVSRAQNYRLNLRDVVKNKRSEVKKTTSNPDIQKALFNEFITAERNSAKYQTSRNVLKWTHGFEKENWPIDQRKLVLKNVKWVGERELRENGSFDIGEYMRRFESGKDYIFIKEDFEEIMKHFMNNFDTLLAPLKDLLKQRQDRQIYETALQNPELGQQLMTKYLNDPMIAWLKDALFYYFTYTLGREYSSRFDFSCKRDDLNKIFRDYSQKFMEQLSLLGDLRGVEMIQNSKFSNTRSGYSYDNLKKMNIFKWDVHNTFVAANSWYANMISYSVRTIGKEFEASDFLRSISGHYSWWWHLELSSKELDALALNKKREEKKDELMSKIHNIVYKINDAAWEQIHDTHDYYIWENDSKYGKIGNKLMKLPFDEIEKRYVAFQQELDALKNKRKSGVSEILSLLQNKPERKKPSKASKKIK